LLKRRFSARRNATRLKTFSMIIKKASTDKRDARVARLYEQLVEI
jgi:hypothetical protein